MADARMNRELATRLSIELPPWATSLLEGVEPLAGEDARIAFVLQLADAAATNTHGGPFAAAIFRARGGELLAAGVNMVLASRAPVAHAEIVAIALAGTRLDTFDLAQAGPIELVTSCEPCAMCMGSLPWAGITRVVIGARDEDARAVGFDEGDKREDWAARLQARGIDVVRDVRRAEAAAILRRYADRGGLIYNGRTPAERAGA
jgi:tRNA(Arg) A34 adenosine deaminase TadA